MAAQERRGGCGCCGFFFAFALFLVALLLVGVGFLYVTAANNLNKLSSATPAGLPAAVSSRQTYTGARQKIDHFFSNPAERTVTLSNSEVNALLAGSPELRILQRGTVVLLNQNAAELYCSLPVNLPLLSGRFLNYTIYFRPSLRGANVELGVSRIDREGKTLGPRELRQFQMVAVSSIDKILSGWNNLQFDRSVRDVRIENGNLILSR